MKKKMKAKLKLKVGIDDGEIIKISNLSLDNFCGHFK